MPYSRITAAWNGAASLAYAFNGGKGHNGNEARNQLVSGIGLAADAAVPYSQQMDAYWRRADCRCKIQTYRVIQSFSREELDPDDPDDIIRAHEIGRESAKSLFPDHQVAVFTQTDGKSGLLHNHLIVSNINIETGKALKGRDVHYRRIEIETDKIAESYIHDSSSAFLNHEPNGDVINQTVRGRRLTNEKRVSEGKAPLYIWQDDLRERIVKAASLSSDYDEFEKNLETVSVGMKVHKPKKTTTSCRTDVYITYELKDTSGFKGKIPKNLKSKSYKLGANYDIQKLDEVFAANREAAAHKTESQKSKSAVNENASVEKMQAYGKTPSSDFRPVPDSDTAAGQKVNVRSVPFEEAEKLAEQMVRDMFGARHPDKDFGDTWPAFRKWRSDKHKTGRIKNIYDKDKVTDLVTLDTDALGVQFLRFDTERIKAREEQKKAELEAQVARDLNRENLKNRRLPNMNFVTDDNKQDNQNAPDIT